jgi:hypothetical protein
MKFKIKANVPLPWSALRNALPFFYLPMLIYLARRYLRRHRHIPNFTLK